MDEIKEALHRKIDGLELPKVKITTIRITVTLKIEDTEQGERQDQNET